MRYTARSMVWRICCFLMIAVVSAWAAAPEGVPRELARERAADISDVRYRLSFELAPHAAITAGHEELKFVLKSSRPVLLDYREGKLRDRKSVV